MRSLGLSRPSKRAVSVIADATVIPAALWSALALKYETFAPPILNLGLLLLVAALTAIPIFIRMGLYRAVVRYFGMSALFAVLGGTSLSVVALAIFDRFFAAGQLSFSVLGIYWALSTLYTGGTRMAMRYVFHRFTGRHAERVAIYGAGEAGAQLCAAVMGGRECLPVAFIDDKRALQGTLIHGIEVQGPRSLPRLVGELGIEGVLLALPTASRRRKREILAELEPLGLHVRSLPDMSDILAGKATLSDIREVEVADLLGRDSVPPNQNLFEACIRSKSVMVTGAGGSIGSELCRQIIARGPTRLVLFENSELALYQIDMELRTAMDRDGLNVDLISLVGNAHHRDRVLDVMHTFRVQTVYHAAARAHCGTKCH